MALGTARNRWLFGGRKTPPKTRCAGEAILASPAKVVAIDGMGDSAI